MGPVVGIILGWRWVPPQDMGPVGVLWHEELQRARILHCENNILKMYVKHVECSYLNTGNINVSVNLQTFVSPTDTTHILNIRPTVFDDNYIPEEKVDLDLLPGFKYTITESMGSSLGEISFPSSDRKITVKQEPVETVGDILMHHSPECQLCVQITNIISLSGANRIPMPTDGDSTDSTVLGGIQTSQAQLIDSSILMQDMQPIISSSDSCSQDTTLHPSASQDVTPDTPHEMDNGNATVLQDVTETEPSSQVVTDS